MNIECKLNYSDEIELKIYFINHYNEKKESKNTTIGIYATKENKLINNNNESNYLDNAQIKIKKNINENSEKREEKKDKKSSSSFMGVDLGTATSYVGLMNDNKIEILEERGNGSRLIPSVVCFTNEDIY